MTHDAIRTCAHDLVIGVNLELEVVMPTDRDDRPERERDTPDAEHETEPHDLLGRLERWARPEPDDRVGHPKEGRGRLRDAARTLHGRPTAFAASCSCHLHHEHDNVYRAA